MSYPFTPFTALQRQAATPAAGVALINGTQTIVSWTPPNDGLAHRVTLFSTQDNPVATTGGTVLIGYTLPDGFSTSHTVYGANQSGDNIISQNFSIMVKGGTLVQVFQNTAVTAGSSIVWAELWGF